MYIAFLYQILFESNESNYDEVMRCDVTQLNDLNVFKQFESLLKVFLEELFNNFNTYNQIEHFINLQSDKLFKGDSIYNISHNKLATIRDYLNNALKKKWIRFLNN